MKAILTCLVLSVAFLAGAAEWTNVDAEHYLGGRKASAGYLQGKVVLVCMWQADDGAAVAALLPALEEVWTSFKAKQFVVLGAPVGGAAADGAVKELIRKHNVTFPVYSDAARTERQPNCKSLPFIFVLDETGKTVYLGHDDRAATQAVVTAITDMEAPRNAKQWMRFLDYELDNLPCHGYIRLREFRKKFPKEVGAYEAKAKDLLAIPDLKKAAGLVEFAKKAKDPPVFGPKDKAKKAKYQKLVEDVVSKCAAFKDHPDPRVAQEAKNALADLKWAQAGF